MKKSILTITAIVIVLMGLQIGVCLAEEAQTSIEPATMALTGKVTAVKNDMGDLISINLLVTENAVETEYRITLDDMGKKLAEMDGMTVNATGTVTDVEGLKWLTITECTKQE
ncbi:hypothetical protein JW823_02790 [bacterium]|nr:hypothetical protein [candidate division CSSED10-310 bacterium]